MRMKDHFEDKVTIDGELPRCRLTCQLSPLTSDGEASG